MPRFPRKPGKNKPLIRATVKRLNPQGWKFVQKLGKLTFAQLIVRKVTEAITAIFKPKMEKLKEDVKQAITEIPITDLPIRDMERDDLVEGLELTQAGAGFVVGVKEDEPGRQSGEALGELLAALEQFGKVKELTPAARRHFTDRGVYIPEGAKYLVLPPNPVLGPAFETFQREVSGRASAIMTTAAIVYRSEVKRA